MSMVMMRPPDHGKMGAAEVKKLTSAIGTPIPDELKLGLKTVSIADLVVAIDCFRHQLEMLMASGQNWPCAQVRRRAHDAQSSVQFAPLDLGTHAKPKGDRAEVSSGRASERVTLEARAAGFQVREVLPTEADKTFAEMLGALLGKRATGDSVGNDEPPPNPFEVTTDSARIEIVYSVGYFVSTKRGFGFSTPARRELRWGDYLFGASVGGAVQFSDTLWTIPDVHSIHLAV